MNIRHLTLSIALLAASSLSHSQDLTTYVTEWSGTNGYPFDGSHPSAYHNNSVIFNADMANKAKKSNVLAFAFLQAWNSQLIQKYNVPSSYLGMLHFSDLWADLPSNVQGDEYTTWKNSCVAMSPGSCTTIQLSGVTGAEQFFDYKTTDVGQMNNFGAFLKLKMPENGKKIISIGGANLIGATEDNTALSSKTFDAIFSNQTVFLNSLTKFMDAVKPNLDGIDYDFEPRIDGNGGQMPALDASGNPSAQAIQDYQNLFNLIKNTRAQLPNAYISVTLTPNMDYIKAIDSSESKGWFKQISPYVNKINIMTYDMHGAWSNNSDPGTLPHEMLNHDNTLPEHYTINYGVSEVVQKLKNLGMDSQKIQIGLATYGRGFAGVPQTTTPAHLELPGYDQTWTGPSHFDQPNSKKPSIQDGLLPYNEVNRLLNDPSSGYKNYEVMGSDHSIIGSYLYSAIAKQFVGYISPNMVTALCTYSKNQNLGGAIVWSMDSDASYDGSEGQSLIDQYAKQCA